MTFLVLTKTSTLGSPPPSAQSRWSPLAGRPRFTLPSMLTIGVWLLPVSAALTLACALHTARAWSARPARP